MHILMATGGSVHSETAVWLGSEIAAMADDTPTVLTVVESEEKLAEAEEILARSAAIVTKSVAEVTTKVRIGKPEREIITEAGEGDYDLVVVGERQMHGLKTRMFGSVAKHVLEEAPCSVLLAKGKIESLRTALLCYSGAGEQTVLDHILQSPLAVLATGDITITALHVSSADEDEPGSGTEATAIPGFSDDLDSSEHLQYGIPQPEPAESPAVKRIERRGVVTDEILKEAQIGDYDLVIIGVRPPGGKQRFFLADFASDIAARIDRPLLAARF